MLEGYLQEQRRNRRRPCVALWRAVRRRCGLKQHQEFIEILNNFTAVQRSLNYNRTIQAIEPRQEKRRREEAIAQSTGLRVLKATSDAVPVRLMKRDLLFVTERLAAVLDERRLAVILRIHGIGKANGAGDTPAKLLTSFLRKADESTIGRVLVAITVLQSAHNPNESAKALREAAEFYKVDVAAITAKVKQEFAAKEKAQVTRKATEKTKPKQPQASSAKKAKAA